jgi:hypothetical protein
MLFKIFGNTEKNEGIPTTWQSVAQGEQLT